MKNRSFSAVSCLFFLLFALSPAFSSEVCSRLGGTCRDACGPNEAPEAGAFEDCAEKQECCIAREAVPRRLQCCVLSFDAKNFGTLNCVLPEDNACPKGSGSPAPCSQLAFCKQGNY
jgi:hypothetical protein